MTFFRKFLLVGFLLCPYFLSAQETFYYRQERIVKNGSDIGKPSGGQFISFFHDICYESDEKGVSVSNGQLEYNYQESKDYKIYEGKSYFGNAMFKFNKSLDRLNVICPDGVIYVYVKAVPPKEVHTSSLIKPKNQSVYSETGSNTITQSPTQFYTEPINSNTPNNTTSTNPTNNYQSQYHLEVWDEQCPMCKGKKYIVKETHLNTPIFGLEANRPYTKRCSQCGREYTSDYIHEHKQCDVCGGKGTVERRRYTNH